MRRPTLTIEFGKLDDTGRWWAEVRELPGVESEAGTSVGAILQVKRLAGSVIAERLIAGDLEFLEYLLGWDIVASAPANGPALSLVRAS